MPTDTLLLRKQVEIYPRAPILMNPQAGLRHPAGGPGRGQEQRAEPQGRDSKAQVQGGGGRGAGGRNESYFLGNNYIITKTTFKALFTTQEPRIYVTIEIQEKKL